MNHEKDVLSGERDVSLRFIAPKYDDLFDS